MPMNHCPKCGAENPTENNFCFNCGNDLRVFETPEKEESTPEVIAETEPAKPNSTYKANVPLKKPATLAEKSATASLVLSIIGSVLFFALPIQLLAFILGVKGIRSERRIRAGIGIGLSIFGFVGFLATVIFIIANYELIVNSEIFSYIYFSLFGY